MDRRVAIASACVLTLVLAGWLFSSRGKAAASPVSSADRAAGLTFAGVSPGDQAWVEAAIAKARPEAATLIDEVDGLVTIKTESVPNAPWVGVTSPDRGRYMIGLNLAYLDGRRAADRDVTVLHELGHVIDFVLVDDAERDRMAAQVPVSGSCYTADTGGCTAPEERFADTFAKWALRGAVSTVGAGYSVPMPASIEDWGAPLGLLAARLDSRR